MLGIWKDFGDLEDNLSMAELTAILTAQREQEHRRNKFLAAIQGIDLDEGNNDGDSAWKDLQARVDSGGLTTDSNDILSLQGVTAQRMGFGINNGLDYDKADGELKNPFG